MSNPDRFLTLAREIGNHKGSNTDSGRFAISARELADYLREFAAPTGISSVQMVMSVDTDSHSLRSEISGWTIEDPSLHDRSKEVGWTPPAREYHPKSIMEALSLGWKLLGPPVKYVFTHGDTGKPYDQWEWYLVKE